MINKIAPIFVEATQINGCKDSDGERQYQDAAMELFLTFAKEFPRLLSDPCSITEDENEEMKKIIYPQYAEIGDRLSHERRCHSHTTDGYFCYCDER